jgi:AraC-like DNA-binding protein
MDAARGRIVVLRPDLAGTAIFEDSHGAPLKHGVDLIAGHDVFLYVARGEGTFRANGRVGRLRPNTLVAAPPGAFSCAMTPDRELYVLAVRDAGSRVGALEAFTPFVEYEVSPVEGRRWRERMAAYVERAEAGRFDFDDVRSVKDDVLPYVWRSGPEATRETVATLLESMWDRLDDPLRLDDLAAQTGYTPNYLNDLSREHTGRALGRWITDMRMARARTALERSDASVAEVGAACGYDDPAYFSRVFRRAHGVPPATWRIGARPVDARYGEVTVDIELVVRAEAYRKSEQRTYSYAS